MRTAAEHAHWRAQVTDAVVRALDRQERRIRRSLTAAGETAAERRIPPVQPPPPFDSSAWYDDVDEEVRPAADGAVSHAVTAVLAALPAAVASLGGTLGLGEGWPDRIVSSATSLGLGLGTRLDDLNPYDPNYLQQVTDAFDGARGSAVNVGSLASQAGNAVAAQAAAAAGDQGFSLEKTWNTVGDDKVRESHADMDGETIDASDTFPLEGGDAMFPGDPGLPDEEAVGCRCWLTFTGYGSETLTPEQEAEAEGEGG